MPTGMIWDSPANGGSADSLLRYVENIILGQQVLPATQIQAEEMTASVIHQQLNDGIHVSQAYGLAAIFAETNARADLGVEVLLEPAYGEGVRPAAIWAENVYSLFTAPSEIETLGGSATNLKSSVSHYGISANKHDSAIRTNQEHVDFARATMYRAGFKGHPMIFIVHRDKADHVHTHIVAGNVNPVTMAAYTRRANRNRLSRSLRYSELEFGWDTAPGYYQIRDRDLVDAQGNSLARVEAMVKEDWAVHNRQRDADRLSENVGKFLSQEEGLESLLDRQERIEKALRDSWHVDGELQRLHLRADRHLLFARYATMYESSDDQSLVLRVMEKPPDGIVDANYEDDFGTQHPIYARWIGTDEYLTIPLEAIAPSPLDGRDLTPEQRRKLHPMVPREHNEAMAHRAFLADLGDARRADIETQAVVRRDPGRVARDLVAAGRATHFPIDFDRWMAARVTDDDEWRELSDYVMREDNDLTIVSVDASAPLFVTKTQLALEEYVSERAAELAQQPKFVDWDALSLSIAEVEATKAFEFSDEQRDAVTLVAHGFGVVWGNPGVGKTIEMQILETYAQLTNRPGAGFATSAAAAEKLGKESGLPSINLALGQIEGLKSIKENGIVILDEGSMVSFNHTKAVLDRAIEMNATVITALDLSQLKNLEAGDPGRVLSHIGRKYNVLKAVLTVRRQGEDLSWMLDAIPLGCSAIRKGDKEGTRTYFLEYIERGYIKFFTTRQEEIDAKAEDLVAAYKGGDGFIAIGLSLPDNLYVNRRVQTLLGLDTNGRKYKFDRGTRYLSPGTQVVFEKNAKLVQPDGNKQQVYNGYVGIVKTVAPKAITVTLEDGTDVTFNPNWYKHIEFGWACSTYKGQGQDEKECLATLTKSDDAHSANVALTRGSRKLRGYCRMKPVELIDHLTSDKSLRLKDDAMYTLEIINRTGGDNTPWAKEMLRLAANRDDPKHQEYRAEMQQVQRDKGEASQEILRRYAALRRKNGSMSREDLAAQKKELEALPDRFPILGFGAWAYRDRERIVRDAQLRRIREERTLYAERAAPENALLKATWVADMAESREFAKATGASFAEVPFDVWVVGAQERAEEEWAWQREHEIASKREAQVFDLDRGRRDKEAALDAADEARHERNLVAAKAIIVPLKGTPGESYLLSRGVPKEAWDDTLYCPNWPAGVELNDTNADGSPRFSKGLGPAIIGPAYDPVTREIGAYECRYIEPVVFRDGTVLKNWTVGRSKRSISATKGAWDAKDVAIGEGLLDKLSLLAAGKEAFTCLGAGNVPYNLHVAVHGRPVLIATDRDPVDPAKPNELPPGEKMAEKLKAQLESAGSTTTRLLVPWHDRTKKVDVNDALRSGELEASIDRALGIDPLLRESKRRYERTAERGIER